MRLRGIILSILLSGASVSAVGAVYYGRVVDNVTPAKPIANATIALQGATAAAYSDSSGKFSLTTSAAILAIPSTARASFVFLHDGRIVFSCSRREVVDIDLFSLSGRKVHNLLNGAFNQGNHAFALSGLLPQKIGTGLFVASIQKGSDHVFARTIITSQGVYGNTHGSFESSGLPGTTKSSAAADNLIVSRMGYVSKTVPANVADLGDIALSRDPKEAEIDRKADSIIATMSVVEKAGQMCQAQINFTNAALGRLKDADVAAKGIGSVFNGGSDQSAMGKGNLPSDWAAAIDRVQNAVMTSSAHKIPILYAQDCVHGVAELSGCTVFPHNIGLGCTRDTALVAKVGRVTAAECAGVGVRLNFAPCISSVRNERWGRTYEGFGETPEINALLGTAYIRGLQGDGDMSKVGAVAACAKHYVGDGGTTDGVNNGVATFSEATMRAVHLPQYAAGARELIATVMPSYHTWTRDGVKWKQTLDQFALTTVLKTELGFDGFCVSDWDAVLRACDNYGESCVAQAVNAGLDMAMVVGDTNCTNWINSIVAGVTGSTIPIGRVNDAVKRILRVKFRLGLFEHPLSDATLRSRINSSGNRSVAREAVRKSLVLLKNEDKVLPLKKTEKIVVVGSWANSLGAQCGGWTISWQGALNSTGLKGQTIFQGLQELGGENVFFDTNVTNLATADKIVVVVGEKPYAEGQGDILPTSSPDFSTCQNAGIIQTCFNSGKPVILIMITGRPLPIDTELPWCKAIVAAWLPGSEGGGVADVLFGNNDFTGTLSHTWPATAGQIPINAGPTYTDEQHGTGGAPLFEYGFGLKFN
jgi:beta-glucosidase